MPTKPLRACLAKFSDVPRVSTTSMCRKGRILAQTKRRQNTSREICPRRKQKAGVCRTQAAAGGQTSSTKKVEGNSVERQAELVCPRHPGPRPVPPGSCKTFVSKTDEGRHDRSHVISRFPCYRKPGVGPRCSSARGREHGSSAS